MRGEGAAESLMGPALQHQPTGTDRSILVPEAVEPADKPDTLRPPSPLGPRRRGWRWLGHRGSAPVYSIGVLRSTRLRLLAVLFLLLAAAGGVLTLVLNAAGVWQLEYQVQQALLQEIDEVMRLEDERDPETRLPFQTVERAFDLYLTRNLPSYQEAFATFVNGRPHATSLDRYVSLSLPPEMLEAWSAFSAEPLADGEQIAGTFDQGGIEAHYRAVRVSVGGQGGAFVVAIAPQAQLERLADLHEDLRLIALVVVVAATLSGWFLSEAVLKPVRELTETASTVSILRPERLTPTGSPEAVLMVRTFNAMLDRIQLSADSQLEFLRAAGHELRTPLTVVTGHLEVLGDEEDRRRTLPIVLEELHRMGRIVREIESLAESARPDYLARRPTDLAELTERLLFKCEVLGSRRWELDAVADAVVEADPYRLTEAVLNLAENAVAHTHEGDGIAIGSRVEGPWFLLWIRDEGIGIVPEEQEPIFHRFVRGAASPGRYRGAGLGLAVVRAIARAHGGDVEVVSRFGHGARFTLRLPRQPTP
jgi:two-component system, OmpR family, sensor kinase